MPKKTDRRVRYTMALLRSALIELMETRHISQISVKELCEKADVHRSTFYAHYKDAYDLLRQMENELFDDLGAFLSEQDYDALLPISVEKLNQILTYISKDEKSLRAMLGENSDITIQRDIMQYFGFISLPTGVKAGEKQREYINLFCIHGCISIIQKWLQDGMPQPAEEISTLVYKLLTEGVGGFC